jgi:thioredoxin
MKFIKTLSRLSTLAILLSLSTNNMVLATLIHVQSENEYKNILAEKKPVLIKFFAPWCGVCKRAEPEVESLSQKFTNITFIKLNGDNFADLKKQYKIAGYPTFILLDSNGKEVDRIVGRKMQAVEKALAKLKKTKPLETKKTNPQPEKTKASAPKKEELAPKPAEKECTVRCELPEKKSIEIKPSLPKTNHIDLSNAEQFDMILAQAKPMVLDFYTTWCGPCKTMKPIIAELAQENPGVNFITIDAEKILSIAKRYTITGYPTFIFLNATGKQVTSFSGSTSKAMMQRKISAITGTKGSMIILEEHEIPMHVKPVVKEQATKKSKSRHHKEK